MMSPYRHKVNDVTKYFNATECQILICRDDTEAKTFMECQSLKKCRRQKTQNLEMELVLTRGRVKFNMEPILQSGPP